MKLKRSVQTAEARWAFSSCGAAQLPPASTHREDANSLQDLLLALSSERDRDHDCLGLMRQGIAFSFLLFNSAAHVRQFLAHKKHVVYGMSLLQHGQILGLFSTQITNRRILVDLFLGYIFRLEFLTLDAQT